METSLVAIIQVYNQSFDEGQNLCFCAGCYIISDSPRVFCSV